MDKKKESESKAINKFLFCIALVCIILSGIVGIVSADTSIVWTKNIGDVTAADMSDDGSVIYAAVENSAASSTVYIYSVAGVEQTEIGGISGVVQKLVCTADGTQAALYTDADYMYHINGGIIDWSQSYGAAVTDIDISNAGSVFVVQGTQFHKYLSNGNLEYDSAAGTYEFGVIDPNDEFAIVANSGSNVLSKYILSTSDQYWGMVGNNTFNTAFQDFQNLLILYTNETNAIILSNQTLGDELWEEIYGDLSDPNLQKGISNIGVSNSTLDTLNQYSYFDSIGTDWEQTASAQWAARYGACSWVYDGKMWIGGGRTGSAYLRDVWYSTDPYLEIQPAIQSPTYVFYNYTGASPQHTQTTYTGAVPFTGTTELRTKPTLSIYNLQTTKTLNGNIQALSLSDRGDWIGTATTTRIYHDQVTPSGFGTEYYAALGSSGTLYDIATANGASMSIVGQGQITDIYSMSASRVGTYTAGGAVTHVDIADKNALWAASGGEDGKVYVFSKDESSNWYLEYSSDSENPVTALQMSARGEYVLAGRVGSLTLYQTNTPTVTPTEFWFTLYAYKDSDSYRNAAVNVSVYSGSQWTGFAQGLTDSAGKYVVQLTAGQNYKFDIGNGEKILIYMASPSVSSQTVSIYSSPISTSIEYNAVWDSASNSIKFNYTDSSAQTEAVTVKIVRIDNWETVYDQTFNNQQSIEEVLPIIDDTTSYKVEFSVRRVAGVTRNTFIVSSSRDVIPIPLDQNIKNILFCGMLFVIAGLFSYLSAYRGPIVVTLVAGFFIYIGWVTIPWEWFVITIAVAIVASMSQRRS